MAGVKEGGEVRTLPREALRPQVASCALALGSGRRAFPEPTLGVLIVESSLGHRLGRAEPQSAGP